MHGLRVPHSPCSLYGRGEDEGNLRHMIARHHAEDHGVMQLEYLTYLCGEMT